jgi:hypothetical protein
MSLTKGRILFNHTYSYLDTVRSLTEQAVALENSYKERLLQKEEIDQRIQLWRDTLEICETHSERGSYCCNS